MTKQHPRTPDPNRPRTDRTTAHRRGSVTPTPTPVSVWPVGPLHDACATPGCTAQAEGPPCAGRLPDRLWYRTVGEFSRPGDLVLVADAGTGAAVAACADFGRRVIARAATRTTRTRIRLRALTRTPITGSEALTVFGDAPRRRTGRLAVTWPARTHRRPASLLLVPTPCTLDRDGRGLEPGGDAWQRQVITDAVHLLHPGALIVAVTATTPADGRSCDGDGFDDPAGRIITAARERGLGYLQHIVAVHADLTDGHLTLPTKTTQTTQTTPAAPTPAAPTPATPPTGSGSADVGPPLTTGPGRGTGAVHRRAHLDLIVLAVPGGPRDA